MDHGRITNMKEDFPGFVERVWDEHRFDHAVNIHILHEYKYIWDEYVGEYTTKRSKYRDTHFAFPFPDMPEYFFTMWNGQQPRKMRDPSPIGNVFFDENYVEQGISFTKEEMTNSKRRSLLAHGFKISECSDGSFYAKRRINFI